MIIDTIGILIMAILGGARLNQIIAGEWWALPLFAHAGISVFLLIFRGKSAKKGSTLQQGTAWMSALLPFAIQIHGSISFTLRVFSMAGVLFALWSLIVLGKSFDVSPADRGLVDHGPYTFIRHPMYASELFSTYMIGFAEPSLWNILVLLILTASIVLRIRWEEAIVTGYGGYSDRVRARLLPGVW